MTYKAYKYRIYTTYQQTELINKTIGCTKFVYNTLLAGCKKQYEENGKSNVKIDLESQEFMRKSRIS